MEEKQTFVKSSEMPQMLFRKVQKSQQNMLSTSLKVKNVTSTLTGLVLRNLKPSHFIK